MLFLDFYVIWGKGTSADSDTDRCRRYKAFLFRQHFFPLISSRFTSNEAVPMYPAYQLLIVPRMCDAKE